MINIYIHIFFFLLLSISCVENISTFSRASHSWKYWYLQHIRWNIFGIRLKKIINSLYVILKAIWWMKVIFGIMDQCDTKINHLKYIQCQVILLNILKAVWRRNVILGIMDQFDTNTDLIKYIWVSDLYFMAQWFCLISVRLVDKLFDGRIKYFR